jgi:hypothetical protein
MGSVRPVHVETIDNPRDHRSRGMFCRRLRQLGQNVVLSPVRICSADFDSDVLRCLPVHCQSRCRERAIAELVHDAVSIVKTLVNLNGMISSSLVVLEPFHVLDIPVLEARG